jgi:hypothetical protein
LKNKKLNFCPGKKLFSPKKYTFKVNFEVEKKLTKLVRFIFHEIAHRPSPNNILAHNCTNNMFSVFTMPIKKDI